MNLEFVCDLQSTAGYAAHARMMVKAFDQMDIASRGINLKVVSRRKEPNVADVTPDEAAIFDKYLAVNFGKPHVRVFFEPAHFVHTEEGVVTIAFVQWETTKIRNKPSSERNKNWVSILNNCDLVMTSGKDARNSFIESGVTRPILVNPGPIFDFDDTVGELPVAGLVVTPRKGEIIDMASRPVVIGYMAQWSARKNIEAFIRDITVAFAGNPRVCGLLKTYGSSTFNDESAIIGMAKTVRDSCGVANPPDIFLVTEKLSDTEVLQFFNTIDIYYSPSRGEGFNVPASISCSAGIPVLSSAYGGQADFLPEEALVRGSFSPCIGMSAYDSDMFWFNIDEREAINRLKGLADSKLKAKMCDPNSFEEWRKMGNRYRTIAFREAGAKIFVERFCDVILSFKEASLEPGQASVHTPA